MIDLKDLRAHPEKYKTGAQLKGIAVDVDAVLALDEQSRQAQNEFDRTRAEQNQISQQIGAAGKDAALRVQLKVKAAGYKPRLAELSERQRELQAKIDPLLLAIPQPPDADVPPGKDASDNVVV